MDVFLSIAGLLLLAVTLPGTVELTLMLIGAIRSPRTQATGESQTLKLAVVIPAHNEDELIGRCVRSVKAASKATDSDIFVVADNCADRTALEACKAGAQVLERDDPGRRGKGYALDFAFSQIGRDYDAFIVVDADSVVSPSFVRDIADRISAGAEVVQAVYRVNGGESRSVNALAVNAFNGRSIARGRLGLSAGILGNGFALTKSCLDHVPYRATSIVEDLEYHLELVRHGYCVECAEDAWVCCDLPSQLTAASTQRARWEGGRLSIARRCLPPLIRDVLRGKTALIEPTLDLLLLPLSYHFLLLALCLLTPARTWGALALIVMAGQVVIANRANGGSLRWSSLWEVHRHLFWKLSMIPGILRQSVSSARWIRTPRERSTS